MKRIGVLGCGRQGRVIIRALLDGVVSGCELVAVYARTPEKVSDLPCPVATDLQTFLAEKPEIVIEAATCQAVLEHAIPIMESGADLIVLSTSAFADEVFYQKALAAAERLDRRIHLAPGVIGGLDAIEAAAMMGQLEASITKRKFPKGSPGSNPELDRLADDFRGTAAEAGKKYPGLLNVAVSLGLAAGDLHATKAAVEPAPCVDFIITAEGAFGKAEFRTELGAAHGPEFAAWSALAMLKRLTARITF